MRVIFNEMDKYRHKNANVYCKVNTRQKNSVNSKQRLHECMRFHDSGIKQMNKCVRVKIAYIRIYMKFVLKKRTNITKHSYCKTYTYCKKCSLQTCANTCIHKTYL